MTISGQARKLLWGQGANRCAICRKPLTQRLDSASRHTVLGEECHIVAKSASGPRAGGEIPGGDVDGYDNLILLCPNDHRLVDDQPEVFPVARLLELKRRHEVWAHDALGSGSPPTNAEAALRQSLWDSYARCIERWQALGVAHQLAEQLAHDHDTGKVDPLLLVDGPVTVLVGDVGSGKSLGGERLHQAAVIRAMDDPQAPAPIWVRARDASEGIETVVDRELRTLGWERRSVALVVDGLDEIDASGAADLLSETRRVVNGRRGSRAVLTTRLVADIGNKDERRWLPMLEIDESERLIALVSGGTEVYLNLRPQAIQDAARRPLFAIALGQLIGDDYHYAVGTPTEVIDHLVRRAVGVSWHRLRGSLVDLAVRSLRRGGGSVRTSDVVAPHALVDLLATRIVVEERGQIRFPLILFAQWFAAQGIIDEDIDLQEVLADSSALETWKYPLAAAITAASSERATSIMGVLAERNPGFASLVVTEAVRPYARGESDLDDWRTAALAIKRAEQAWVVGLGPLALLVAPMTGGALPPLGANVVGDRLTTAWYRGREPRDQVFELPADFSVQSPSPDFEPVRSSRVPKGSAWAWRWSHAELRNGIVALLKRRQLPILGSPLEREAVWTVALAALGHGSHHNEPIDAGPLLDPAADVDAQVDRIGRLLPVRGLQEALRRHVDAAGLLHPAWPGPDEARGRWVWGGYSGERTRARAEAIYTAALEAYAHFAEGLFSHLATHMHTAFLLPAIARGGIWFSEGEDVSARPMIDWWLEPQLHGPSRAAFVLAIQGFDSGRLRDLDTRAKAARPHAAEWLPSVWRREVLSIVGPAPAQQLVYTWLWRDLQRLGWVPWGSIADWPSGTVPLLEEPDYLSRAADDARHGSCSAQVVPTRGTHSARPVTRADPENNRSPA